MPRISQFYGIAIYMYYRDHAPPHLHAMYGPDEAVFDLATGHMTDGSIPRRASRMVGEWIDTHRDELIANWNSAVSGQPILAVEPLK